MDTLDAYRRWMSDQGYSPATVKVRAQAVRSASTHADVDPTALTSEDVLEWIGSAERAPRTRLKYLEHVRAFCAWAGIPDATDGLRRPPQPLGVPRPISETSLATMLDVADDRARAWIVLGSYCGLRSFETAKVEGRDLEQAPDGSWLLRVLGKGGQLWVVPAPRMVIEELAPWIRRAEGGPLWPGVKAYTVQRAIRLTGVAAGVQCSSHMLRHRYGTAVYAVDRDLLRTQRLMRHRSPATTAGYALVADNTLGALVEQLPGARGRVEPDAGGRHLRIVR